MSNLRASVVYHFALPLTSGVSVPSGENNLEVCSKN